MIGIFPVTAPCDLFQPLTAGKTAGKIDPVKNYRQPEYVGCLSGVRRLAGDTVAGISGLDASKKSSSVIISQSANKLTFLSS